MLGSKREGTDVTVLLDRLEPDHGVLYYGVMLITVHPTAAEGCVGDDPWCKQDDSRDPTDSLL